MMEVYTQTPLQASYMILEKKQKGLILQKIVADNAFTKSEEWLKKYIVGAYKDKINETVEKIGLEVIQSFGFLSCFSESFVPFRLPNNEEKKVLAPTDTLLPKNHLSERENKIVTKIIYPPVRLDKMNLEEIYEVYQHSNSISEVGVAWFTFGQLCRKNVLNKTNPFVKISSIIKEKTDNNAKNIAVFSALKGIYLKNIDCFEESIYVNDWVLFGQYARYTYSVNPFMAIKYYL